MVKMRDKARRKCRLRIRNFNNNAMAHRSTPHISFTPFKVEQALQSIALALLHPLGLSLLTLLQACRPSHILVAALLDHSLFPPPIHFFKCPRSPQGSYDHPTPQLLALTPRRG
eukprot:753374-Hanusia_phi.AAC.10